MYKGTIHILRHHIFGIFGPPFPPTSADVINEWSQSKNNRGSEVAPAYFPIYGNAIFSHMGSSKGAAQKHSIMNYEQLLSSFFLCFRGLKNNLEYLLNQL